MKYAQTIKRFKDIADESKLFKVGDVIGSGQYGVIYKLMGRKDKNKVVKIFDYGLLSLGRREIAAAVVMGNNGVGPKVYKAGVIRKTLSDTTFYIVMEKLDGELYTLKDAEPKYYLTHRTYIRSQIQQLIEKMHDLRFVHADLKDDNIGYTKQGSKPPKIFILDFGFATKYFKDIDTNLDFASAISRSYIEMGFKAEMFNKFAFEVVLHRYYTEKGYNTTLKNTFKKPLDIKKLEKLYKKLETSKYTPTYINVNQGGPMRIAESKKHWILYNVTNLVNDNKNITMKLDSLLKAQSSKLRELSSKLR